MMPIIQSLWIGNSLSDLEKLCIQSFLDHGHEFHLYTYTDILGIPSGALVKDGNDVLPESAIYRHHRGSFALFADWFRWKLLHQRGNWWVDMDVVCLKHFDIADDIVFGVGGNYCAQHTMKFPAGNPFCAHMVNRCANPNKIFREDSIRVAFRKVKRTLKRQGKEYTRWGESGGPAGFTAAAKRFNLMPFGKPTETFSPEYAYIVDASGNEDPSRWHEILLKSANENVENLFPNSYSLHIANQWLHLAGCDKNAAYPPESLIEQLKRKHGIYSPDNAQVGGALKPKTTQTPLITVALPAYNSGRYIRETIDSILNQTEQDFELIVINDGSTDDTEEIVKSYSDGRIRYYTNGENLGIAKTYNRIIEHAKGKYMAIAEADDISHPARFKIQATFLDSHPDIVAVGTRRIEFRGTPPDFAAISSSDYQKILHAPRELRSHSVFSWGRFRHATTMYRVGYLKKHGIYYDPKFKVSCDYDILLRLCLRADIAVLKPELLAYRLHSGSASSASSNTGQNDFATIRMKYLGAVLNATSQVDSVAQLAKLSSSVDDFVAERKHNAGFDYNVLAISASSFLYSRMRKLERRIDDYESIYRIYRQSKVLKHIRLIRRLRLNAKATTHIFIPAITSSILRIPSRKRPPLLFIPARQTVGGPATFLRNLKTYLDESGYPYATKYKRGDSIFFPIRHKTRVLDKVKKHGGKIIQRLDGAYGADEPMRRDRLANVYHNYADWVIYQTEWCKRVCDYQMGERQSPQYRIIPNGVNGDIFYPDDKTYSGNEPVEFVMSGRFKNTEMLDLALLALDKLSNQALTPPSGRLSRHPQ